MENETGHDEVDYGTNPLGGGMVEMVPSGLVVSAAESRRILGKPKHEIGAYFGMTWEALCSKQGISTPRKETS